MALIKATDMAYGRLRAPDLDVMEEFLTRFGMVRSDRTATALYMRGTDPAHHIHVTEKGEPKFVGFAYYAESEDDLERLARAPGASAVEAIDEPGGGRRRAADRAERLPDRGRARHRDAAADRGQAPEAQHRRRSTRTRGRTDAAAQGTLACEADRARGVDDAQVPRDGGVVSRDAGLHLLG